MKSKYRNKWTDGNRMIVAQSAPGEFFIRAFAPSRIKGDSFIPYEAADGSPEWVKSANLSLESAARSNFERRS